MGDETEITLCGLRIRAVFVPGYSMDSVIYMIELRGKRIAFTGDMGFRGGNDILSRCWGDRDKAQAVMRVVQAKLIPWQPDFVFTGHDATEKGSQFLRYLINRSQQSVAQ